MGINYKRTASQLSAVGTTRYVMIPTTPATLLTLDSGYAAISLFNHGSGNLIWGDSNIAVNSGNYQFVNVRVEQTQLQDGWNVYYRADSVQALLSYTQYKAI